MFTVDVKQKHNTTKISSLLAKSVTYLCAFVAERKSKLAKRIRKEIIKVRRKLAIQKGLPNSDLDESIQDTGGK